VPLYTVCVTSISPFVKKKITNSFTGPPGSQNIPIMDSKFIQYTVPLLVIRGCSLENNAIILMKIVRDDIWRMRCC
jgi:hypothetical protein